MAWHWWDGCREMARTLPNRCFCRTVFVKTSKRIRWFCLQCCKWCSTWSSRPSRCGPKLCYKSNCGKWFHKWLSVHIRITEHHSAVCETYTPDVQLKSVWKKPFTAKCAWSPASWCKSPSSFMPPWQLGSAKTKLAEALCFDKTPQWEPRFSVQGF